MLDSRMPWPLCITIVSAASSTLYENVARNAGLNEMKAWSFICVVKFFATMAVYIEIDQLNLSKCS